jgi:ribosomal protein S18 acetylase RimI-like enzyme
MTGDMSADEISLIKDHADQLGVRLSVWVGPSGIELDWIGRRPCAPKGAGAPVLTALCDFADQTCRPIRLSVLHGRDRLIAFYRRYGFSIVRPALDEIDSTEMERVPTTGTASACH